MNNVDKEFLKLKIEIILNEFNDKFDRYDGDELNILDKFNEILEILDK